MGLEPKTRGPQVRAPTHWAMAQSGTHCGHWVYENVPKNSAALPDTVYFFRRCSSQGLFPHSDYLRARQAQSQLGIYVNVQSCGLCAL